MQRNVLALFLLLGLGTPAGVGAEGVEPAIGAAASAIDLGRIGSDAQQAGTELLFRNPGTAASRLLLPSDAARAIACSPDGSTTNRSRPGQFLLAAGAELRCTAEPGRYKVTAISSEGGAIRERSGRLVVR
jgi:hypothetical protein